MELLQAVQEIYDDISNNNFGADIYVQGTAQTDLPEGFKSFDVLMEKASDADIDPKVRTGITHYDTLNYIFTSGTTGNSENKR